ncbi:MAG TPA: serine/threonine-protein kinase [Polyangiaceae bacterium]
MAKLFDPSAGRLRVDRYELLGEIASGGMATVYLARLMGVGGFQRFVAMKRLHPHLQTETEFVEMFLDEARIAARIHHPNVVPILEVGASTVGYYLVMEFIEGDTLARLLARAAMRGKKLPVPIALRITLDMLAGLHAAHELRDDAGEAINLVHRDVSPQNVLVGVDGVARITDFGVARAASRLTATRVGQLKGKIAYMAPEQASGDENLDRRADVFSSGIVLWEALASKRLFKAENEAATLTRVISEPVPSLERVGATVSPKLNSVVMKALERARERRFASCAELADALEAAAAQNDKIATPRELAAYVASVLGDEVSAQRDALRVWLAATDPGDKRLSGFPPSSLPASSVSAAAMSLPGFGVPTGVTRTTLSGPAPVKSKMPLALAVLLLMGAAGVAGFLYTHPRAPQPIVQVAPAAPANVPATTAPVPMAEAPAPAANAATPLSALPALANPAPGTARRPQVTAAARPAAEPSEPAKPKAKKKADDDVDLRNPYR